MHAFRFEIWRYLLFHTWKLLKEIAEKTNVGTRKCAIHKPVGPALPIWPSRSRHPILHAFIIYFHEFSTLEAYELASDMLDFCMRRSSIFLTHNSSLLLFWCEVCLTVAAWVCIHGRIFCSKQFKIALSNAINVLQGAPACSILWQPRHLAATEGRNRHTQHQGNHCVSLARWLWNEEQVANKLAFDI